MGCWVSELFQRLINFLYLPLRVSSRRVPPSQSNLKHFKLCKLHNILCVNFDQYKMLKCDFLKFLFHLFWNTFWKLCIAQFSKRCPIRHTLSYHMLCCMRDSELVILQDFKGQGRCSVSKLNSRIDGILMIVNIFVQIKLYSCNFIAFYFFLQLASYQTHKIIKS